MTHSIKRILIAVDLADTGAAVPPDALNAAHAHRDHRAHEAAERLVEEVLPLAQALGASMELVYVRETRTRGVADGPLDVDEVDDWIDQRLERLAERASAAGVACITTSLQGSVQRELVAHAKKTTPDLVVMGSHGRSHFLESRAEHVLLEARRRVLVVPLLDLER